MTDTPTKILSYPSMTQTPPERPAELPAGTLHYAASPDLTSTEPQAELSPYKGFTYPSMQTEVEKPPVEKPPEKAEAALEVKSPPLPSEVKKPEAADTKAEPKKESDATVPDLDESDRQYVAMIKSDKPEAWVEVASWMEEDIRQLNTLAGVSEDDNRDDMQVVDYLKRKILNADVPAQWRQYWARQAFAFRLMAKDLRKQKFGGK